MIETERELALRFNYHKPGSHAVAQAHELVREAMRKAARDVYLYCPEGREQSLAITKLEEAMMWANAAIARHHKDNFPAEVE